MKPARTDKLPQQSTDFDPADPDRVIAAVIAILGEENLARGPQAFAKAINASPATVYRKLADGTLRAKLLDSKPLIPFWEQVRFIAALPDWKPVAQRKSCRRITTVASLISDKDVK